MTSAPSGTRSLLIEVVIALLACAGGYSLLVQPTKDALAKARHDIAVAELAQSQRSGLVSLSQDQINDLHRVTAERLAQIDDRSAPAQDEAAMYSRISALASATNIRVEQLTPRRVTNDAPPVAPAPPPVNALPAPGSPGADPAAAVPKPINDARVAYSMSVTGTYSDLAAFLQGITNKLGYAHIVSVRLQIAEMNSPTGENSRTTEPLIRANIETEHLALDTSQIKLPNLPIIPLRSPEPIGAAVTPSPSPAAQAAAGHE